MKRMITKFSIVAIVVLFGMSLNTKAQVIPTTPGVTLLCSGSNLELPDPGSGFKWLLRYSATQTTTPAGVTLPTDNILPAASVQTGYYYLIKIGTSLGSCESEMQEIPVYKFAPLPVTLAAADYCEENAANTTFTGPTTSPDPNATTLAYQWYTVTGTAPSEVETKITTGGNAATYTPTNVTPGSTTKYRLKVGYSVAGNNYCVESADATITVTPKPTVPTITVPAATATTF